MTEIPSTLEGIEVEPVVRLYVTCPDCKAYLFIKVQNRLDKTRPIPLRSNGKATNLDGLAENIKRAELKRHRHSGECPKFVLGQNGILFPGWMRNRNPTKL